MFILMAWIVNALAAEQAPEMPFAEPDHTASPMSPTTAYQVGGAGDMGVTIHNETPTDRFDEGKEHSSQSDPVNLDQKRNPEVQTVPEAPAKVARKLRKAEKRPSALAGMPFAAKNESSESNLKSGLTIKPKPGTTESVVIAKGKLNRIVTPYADPKVLTVDNVETKIDGAVVYIATDSEMPVSLFISDVDTGNATSLQLLPREMDTPVEIKIEQDQSKGSEPASSKSDSVIRQDSPYITEIKSVMQGMGKQQIPPGFTLEEVTEEIRVMSLCHGTDLTFYPGQLLSGHDSRIVVMVMQNKGTITRVFEEGYCATDDVMAVAAWPKVRLEPGEQAEVYVLMRLPMGKNGEEIRPMLIHQGG
jgi:conjugal transfer pilus assembly protein TraK